MRVRFVLKVLDPNGKHREVYAVVDEAEGSDSGRLAVLEGMALDVEGLHGWDRMLVFPFSLVEGAGEHFVKWEPENPLAYAGRPGDGE